MPTRASLAGPLLMLGALAAACGDRPDSRAGFAGTVRDSAGVQIVENTSTGTWGQDGGWATEQILSIGEAAGDPEYQFGQVVGVDALSDGRILVMDGQAQRLQVYGPDGTYRRTIGGPGSGPGEFSPGVNGVFVGRGDTILVTDMGNQRVVLVPPDGEPTSFPMRMEDGIPFRFELSGAGELVVQRRSMGFGDAAADASPNDLIATLTYDGAVTDTLLTPKRGGTFEMSDQGPRFRFFSPEPRWTMLGGGQLAYASNDAYRVSVFGEDGAVRRIITFPHEPRAVTERDQEAVRQLMRRQMEESGAPPQMVDQMLGAVSFAESWPAFTQLRGGPGGTLWVQRVRYLDQLTDEERETWNPQLDQGSPEWDVFEQDGRYGGVVTLPTRFTPMTIRDDRIYGVYRDDFDVQHVRVLDLRSGPAVGEG